jgi:hypothetical protein
MSHMISEPILGGASRVRLKNLAAKLHIRIFASTQVNGSALERLQRYYSPHAVAVLRRCWPKSASDVEAMGTLTNISCTSSDRRWARWAR